jgi:F0F1-type ATP synthase membrane subunit b/b'
MDKIQKIAKEIIDKNAAVSQRMIDVANRNMDQKLDKLILSMRESVKRLDDFSKVLYEREYKEKKKDEYCDISDDLNLESLQSTLILKINDLELQQRMVPWKNWVI